MTNIITINKLASLLGDSNEYPTERLARLRLMYLINQAEKIYQSLDETGGTEEQYALGDILNLMKNLITESDKTPILDTMKIGYEQYLFAQLWACKDDTFAELPYDQQWDEIPRRWKEFEKSAFNNPEKPIYDCILAFLESEELL
jgi:hypothetical protein